MTDRRRQRAAAVAAVSFFELELAPRGSRRRRWGLTRRNANYPYEYKDWEPDQWQDAKWQYLVRWVRRR